MDADQIISSLEIASERGGDLTAAVYGRLFAEQPEMEAQFVRDTNGAVKGEMLSRVFEAILDFIGDRRFAATLIQCEVVTHDGYGVPPDVFATFFGTVAATVQEAVGDAWTPAMQASWTQLLADLDYYVTHPDQSQTVKAA
jgi:hemoglobin-like flavoprotein